MMVKEIHYQLQNIYSVGRDASTGSTYDRKSSLLKQPRTGNVPGVRQE